MAAVWIGENRQRVADLPLQVLQAALNFLPNLVQGEPRQQGVCTRVAPQGHSLLRKLPEFVPTQNPCPGHCFRGKAGARSIDQGHRFSVGNGLNVVLQHPHCAAALVPGAKWKRTQWRFAELDLRRASDGLMEPVPPEAVFGLVRIGGRDEKRRWQPILAQDRPSDFTKVSVSVIKGQKHGSFGKTSPLLSCVERLLHGHNVVTVRQVLHLPGEHRWRRANEAGIQGRRIPWETNPVVGQNP